MSAPARALYLGAAGPLALVRCGLCGRRNCFDRRRWQWFEVAFCRRCWQGVLFEGLVMITRWEGERLLMENEAFGGELRAQREAERAARSFLAYFDAQPYWLWPPMLRRAAADMRQAYALAEAARARTGGGAEVGQAPRSETAVVPPPAEGAAAYGPRADESRVLHYYATLPAATRAAMLTELEALSRRAAAGGEVRTSALLGVAADAGEGGGRE